MKPIALAPPERTAPPVTAVVSTPPPVQPETVRPVRGHVELSDQQFAHALKMGVLVGIPIVYAVVVVITMLAVPGNAALTIAALWPAIVGGPFFAGFAYVLLTEARCQPEASRAQARQTSRGTRHRAAAPRARLAH